jgi:hypothetical protein
MMKRYIITSAYNGKVEEMIGNHIEIGEQVMIITKDNIPVGIIPNSGFMIQIMDV